MMNNLSLNLQMLHLPAAHCVITWRKVQVNGSFQKW
jgi:hypothetical protein